VDPAIYAVAVLAGLAILAFATVVAPRHKRPCPRCGLRIPVSARRCRACGYEPT
jgi:Uncharacterised protein family UPF0547